MKEFFKQNGRLIFGSLAIVIILLVSGVMTGALVYDDGPITVRLFGLLATGIISGALLSVVLEKFFYKDEE